MVKNFMVNINCGEIDHILNGKNLAEMLLEISSERFNEIFSQLEIEFIQSHLDSFVLFFQIRIHKSLFSYTRIEQAMNRYSTIFILLF
jgi:hypothetical protein